MFICVFFSGAGDVYERARSAVTARDGGLRPIRRWHVRRLRRTVFDTKFDPMDTTQDVEPITTLKRDASQLIARATNRQSPIVITQNGRATAVLQDVESFERARRALLLLKMMVQGERDYEQGRTLTSKQAKARLRKVLGRIAEEEEG